jgi:hypothetical protein
MVMIQIYPFFYHLNITQRRGYHGIKIALILVKPGFTNMGNQVGYIFFQQPIIIKQDHENII